MTISGSFKNIFFTSLLWHSFESVQLWNYQDFEGWGDVSPTCSVGQNQSPVDLRPDVVGIYNGRPFLELQNYNSPAQEITFANSGHTIELTGTWKGNTPSIAGSVVLSKEVYNFVNAHLHWSTDNNNGTEHSIAGREYAAELHLVHYNGKYGNGTEAENQPDGIAVIGILFEVNDNVTSNPGMQRLATLAQSTLSPGDSNTVTSFDLSSLIPNPVPSFFSYSGSLTTPPCSENVRWIVLSEPLPISSQIINVIRQVALDDGDTDNIRPLQPINTRLIEFYNGSRK